MAAKLQCEICGGKLIGRPGGVFECDSCGMEYDTAWAKEKIQEITGTVKVEGTVEVTGKVQIDGPVKVEGGTNKATLLQRGKLALEDGEWDKAKEIFNQVLNMEPQSADAYFGIAMAEGRCVDKEHFEKSYVLADSPLRLNASGNLVRARQFSPEIAAWLDRLDNDGAEADLSVRQAEVAHEQTLSQIRKKLNTPAKKMLAVGNFYTLGLKSDGTVLFAGNDSNIQCDVVSTWEDIVPVSAADYALGLKADGTVVSAGRNFGGECEVSDWSHIIEIATGSCHSVGLKDDGTVISTKIGQLRCEFDFGQCNTIDWKNIISVAVGAFHTVGLKADGTVVAVGYNKHGECNVDKWKNIVAIAAGSSHTVGLKSDGTVVATKYIDVPGDLYSGQCEVSDWRDIVSVVAGDNHTVGLKAEGTLVAAGSNQYGECNVSDWSKVVALVAGPSRTLGLKADGTIVAAGSNHFGENNITDWKLFESYLTIDSERKAAIERAKTERKMAEEKAEAERRAARLARIESLVQERTSLQEQLQTIKGLFAGLKKEKIETRLSEIEKELEQLG